MQFEPAVLREKVFSMAVCVPELWTDEQIAKWVETQNPCGTFAGWYVAKKGDGALRDPQTQEDTEDRIPCAEREGMVHVVVTC
jgi:hypothetical protein